MKISKRNALSIGGLLVILCIVFVQYRAHRQDYSSSSEGKKSPALTDTNKEEKLEASGDTQETASNVVVEEEAETERMLNDVMPPRIAIPDSVPDLPKEQQASAEEAFLREGQKWNGFTGFSALVQISIANEDTQEQTTLEAMIDVGQPSARIRPDAPRGSPNWSCPVVVRAMNGEWSFSTEEPGSSPSESGEHWEYQDGVNAMDLEAYRLPILPKLLVLPVATYSVADQGQGIPGSIPLDDFRATFGFWKNPDPAARDVPNSFMMRKKKFPNTNANDASKVYLFSNGHMSFMGSSASEPVSISETSDGVSYGDYEDFDGLSFPTTITLRQGGVVQRLRFSEVQMKSPP